MESKKINQLATELAPELSDLTIIGDPTTGISKKITLSQMASLFTGTVEEYASLSAFPLVGAADTIYIALDTNIIYRWNTGTSAYVELSPNIVTSLVFNDANGFDGTISLVGSTATLTITTALTTGSVGFIGASGALTQDNSNFFWDNSNKRLGINTNAPTTALDVFGSGIIGRVNGTSTNNAFFGFASAGTNKWSVGNVQSDHRFRIYSEANTSELVSVLQTGQFGIGIANPTTKLHIDGGASALITNLDADVSVAKSISFRSDNSARINLEVSGTESGSNAGADLFIRTYTDAGALAFTSFFIKRSTGYIGIGTTNPTRQFYVNDTAFFDNAGSGTTTNPSIAIGSTTVGLSYIGGGALALLTGSNTRQYITLTGLIGINTTNPTARFQIHGAPDSNYGTLCVFDTTTSAIGTGGMIALGGYKNNTSNEALYAQLIGAKENATLSNEAAYFAIKVNTGSAYTERFRITSIGNIGIGTSSPAELLHLYNSGTVYQMIQTVSGGAGTVYRRSNSTAPDWTIGHGAASANQNFEVYTSGSGTFTWTMNGSERCRITPTGYFKQSYNGSYINSTGGYNEFSNNQSGEPVITSTCYGSSISDAAIYFASFEIDHNNSTAMFFRGRGGANTRVRLYSNGGIANYQANNVNLSDERTKKDIIPLDSYWNKFKDIEIVKFKYKDQTHDDFNIGVIAQQVEKVAPEFIDIDGFGDTPEDGIPLKTVYTSDLHHATIKVLQEAMAKIEILEAKVKQLEPK